MVSLECSLPSDIGNRITELSKAVLRMHNDMKVVQQLLMDDVHNTNDALNKDGSSVLGKYIIGAKNNFRGFNSRQEDKNVPLKVTVHHGEEGVDREKCNPDTTHGLEVKQHKVDQAGVCEGLKVTDCDVVKMEEGRAKAQLGVIKEAVNKGQVEAGRNDNTSSDVKEEAVAGAGFDHVEESVKVEAAHDVAEKSKEGEMPTGVRDGEKHTEKSQEQAEKSVGENTDMKSIVNKFKDIELQEKKVEAKWRRGRKFEHNVAENSDHVRDSNEKPASKKIIPSPTGSSSSQDTGFGSQEGEGSIDGMLVSP